MKALLALIFGILGLVLIWVPVVGLVLAVLAIVFWSLQRENPKGIATVGLVLAIIAIVFQTLIVVGALAMFGVLEPNSFMPGRCIMPAGMDCLDNYYDNGNIYLEFQNNKGVTVEISRVELVNSDTDEICKVDSNVVVGNMAVERFIIPCTLTSEDLNRFDVVVSYRNQGSDLEKTVAGDLVIRG
ncbi:MAG: DUF4190 domain-containing protein [Nanoarchaeota archaeon]|nr:DUF4190 domain-containing protein [Nanoarchaeota archaeon]